MQSWVWFLQTFLSFAPVLHVLYLLVPKRDHGTPFNQGATPPINPNLQQFELTLIWQFFPSQILVGDRHLFHWDLDHHHHHIPWGKRLDVENGPIRGLFDPKETHGENPDLFVNVLPWRNPGWSLGQVIPYHIP